MFIAVPVGSKKEISVNRKVIIVSALVGVVAVFFSYQLASAHTTIHVGNYDVEVGWVDEPPIVGQRNAVVVNVSNTANASSVVDISKLTVDVNYGGQTKTLTLQPLSEDTTNQYIGPILPLVAGQYSVQLRGQLDSTNISSDVQPEEVVPSDTLAFPSASASHPKSGGISLSGWVAAIGLIVGLAALVLALMAYRKAG
jgi:hypothetical protein